MTLKPTLLVLLALPAAACAGAQQRPSAPIAFPGESAASVVSVDPFDDAAEATQAEAARISDPFEPVNRRIFAFNSGLDRVILEPVSVAYRTVVPDFGRERVRDAVDNLKTPIWFANEVLQADFEGAATQAGRFALNSTVGLAGLYDVAGRHGGLPKNDEDFGQTLGRWGAPHGPYLMLPVLGPSSVRDLAGTVVDAVGDPIQTREFFGSEGGQVAFRVVDTIDIRYRTDGVFTVVEESLDPYATARSIYAQTRLRRVMETDRDADPAADDPFADDL